MWLLLTLLPKSDCLLYQLGLIMFFCWQQIYAFQWLHFWYKLPQFCGHKLESFPQFVSDELSNGMSFF